MGHPRESGPSGTAEKQVPRLGLKSSLGMTNLLVEQKFELTAKS